ncbi:SAM-dependent methyltransferase [Streptomyces coffeae]|uniref:Class I SAM-dependent methyltransferase n=1 Tax=Streptomyces coffeae TaxID=621382 RepID=A0ABS1NIS1_9ACTN|nr:class I SAM-dependent methyltransferase [Streptomyces coffeae]MBL1099790.1 class I SAM-dependent methyltransferase [Streptomyces coffeae]
MDRQRISRLAHADHPIAAPLADTTVERLLERAVPEGARVLDLGCGRATWLQRILALRPDAVAEGVDTDGAALALGREESRDRGVGDRLVLHEGDATAFTAPHRFEVVLSVGAAHAFGGLLPTLAAARRHLAPGGRVLIGDGFWEREPDTPTLGALDAVPEDYADLATTVDRVVADGWTPVHGHISTLQEWDDYEWSWTGALERWALDHLEDPGAVPAHRAAVEHRDAWLKGYRGTLGFLTLLLRPSLLPPSTPR